MMELPPELHAALLGRRVVFLRGRLDEQTANATIAQLLLLGRSAQGARQPIELYVDSPSGSLGAALMVYDVVRTLGPPVSTTCLGTAGGAAVLVVAAGASGRRAALPHARIHLADDAAEVAEPTRPAPPDLAGQAQQAARLRARWLEALASHTAHSPEYVARDLAAGRWLSAAEARDYGLVDGIIPASLGGVRPA